MTITNPLPEKPVLRKGKDGIWYCIGGNVVGEGISIKMAYNNYYMRSKVMRRWCETDPHAHYNSMETVRYRNGRFE